MNRKSNSQLKRMYVLHPDILKVITELEEAESQLEDKDHDIASEKRKILDLEFNLEKAEKQLAAVREWGKNNQQLIDYVQDCGKPTFEAAIGEGS